MLEGEWENGRKGKFMRKGGIWDFFEEKPHHRVDVDVDSHNKFTDVLKLGHSMGFGKFCHFTSNEHSQPWVLG